MTAKPSWCTLSTRAGRECAGSCRRPSGANSPATPAWTYPSMPFRSACSWQAQVNRIGDPLYGYLRRLSAISNGTLALIPVEVRHRASTAERPGAVEVVAALVDVRSGRVPWFGVVQGAPGDGSSPGALASAADALARLLFPAGGWRGAIADRRFILPHGPGTPRGRREILSKTITVISGDGIGPEVTAATLTVLDAVGADLLYEEHLAGISAV